MLKNKTKTTLLLYIILYQCWISSSKSQCHQPQVRSKNPISSESPQRGVCHKKGERSDEISFFSPLYCTIIVIKSLSKWQYNINLDSGAQKGLFHLQGQDGGIWCHAVLLYLDGGVPGCFGNPLTSLDHETCDGCMDSSSVLTPVCMEYLTTLVV